MDVFGVIPLAARLAAPLISGKSLHDLACGAMLKARIPVRTTGRS